MIRIRRYGPVTQIRMARAVAGRPLHWTCAYHLDGLLIDTGCAHTVRELVAALEGSEVTQVVNTHHHEDHVGGNAAIGARFHVRAQIHPLGVERLQRPGARLPLYRRIAWGRSEQCFPQPLGDRIVTDRYVLRVIHAPGHSTDQVVLFEEREGWLFSVDLPVGRLFCGLGTVIDDGGRVLRDKLAYCEGLCRQIMELHEAGRPAVEIRRTLLGAEGFLRWVSFGDFAKQHIVDQALAIGVGRSPNGSPGGPGLLDT